MLALAGCAQTASTPGTPTPRLADAALEAGYPQMALSVADSILARDPNNVPALVARGDALAGSGRTDDAMAAYRKALSVKPDDPAANVGLGRIEVRRDPHAAERMFRAALRSRPDDPVLLANLGVALDLQERHVEAQAAYRKSLQLAPDAAATKANLGLSLALSGDSAGARQVLGPLADDPRATQVMRDNLAVAQMQPVAPTPPSPAMPAPAQPAPAMPAPAMPAPRAAPTPAMPTPVAPAAAAPTPAAAPVAAAVTVPMAVTSPPAPAAAPSPADAAQTDTPGVYVQLAASDTQEAAQAEWQREQRRTAPLLTDREPQVVQATVGGRTFWRLRVSVATASEGNRLCTRLRAKGVQCWTVSVGI